jgi:predicted nucleotide-binding protein
VGCLSTDFNKWWEKNIHSGNPNLKKVNRILKTRGRQNVVFEHGLFIGALGRENVCCLLQKGVDERPTDIDGILYKRFNKSVSEIFYEIKNELKQDS